jgi:putative endonuclease
MADRYRGTMYVGVNIARAKDRISASATGSIGWCGLSICRRSARLSHEKRIKRWQRAWTFALVERANPKWRDLFDTLA